MAKKGSIFPGRRIPLTSELLYDPVKSHPKKGSSFGTQISHYLLLSSSISGLLRVSLRSQGGEKFMMFLPCLGESLAQHLNSLGMIKL